MLETPDIQQARESVTRLAREIAALADTGGPPEQFFPEFLRRLVTMLGADAGAAWIRNPHNQIALVCEINLASTGYLESAEAHRANERILVEVLGTGQAMIKEADPAAPEEMPTRHVLLLAAIQRGRDCVGVVEIFQRPDAPREARPGYLQIMEQMCGHVSRYLQAREESKIQIDPAEFWKKFEQFVLLLQGSLDISEVAVTAANDGRQLIGCDRASVALRRHGKTTILAMSGTDAVNRRANLVRLMEKMTESVIATGEPLLYAGQIEHLAPQIEAPLADYIHESGSRLVYVIPFTEPAPMLPPGKKEDRTAKQKEPRKTFGALIVEQIAESRPKYGLKDRSMLVAEHTAPALFNALTYQRLFLLPVWRFIGQNLEQIRGRTLYKIIAGVVLLAAVIIGLFKTPWDYRVEGKGRLMPAIQRDAFAAWDGEVVKILANSGDRVTVGQPLVQLRNEELQAKLLAAKNELNEKRQLLFSLQAQLDEAEKKASREESIQLQGKMVQTRIEIKGAEEQARLLQEQTDHLTVRAPIAGVVATFQIDQMLRNRPVQRGEVLLEIMDDEGPWRLELELPENRMGHLLRRQQEIPAQQLPVEFMLATATESTFRAMLENSATKTALTEGEGSVIELLAAIDPEEMPRLKDNLRIGAEVRAKISCGERSLGYVLFGDVIEFIQKRVLFW